MAAPPHQKDVIKQLAGEIVNPHPNTQTLHLVLIISLMFMVALAAFVAGINVQKANHDAHMSQLTTILEATKKDNNNPYNWKDNYLTDKAELQTFDEEMNYKPIK